MTPRLGPIAELRTAVRSPVALVVGACVGGAAPLLSYYTVHLGHLIEPGRVEWRSPLWALVAGAFALSSKSVYRWGRQTFGDPWSAAALVAMLEGALLLSPHPVIAKAALVFLVAINATVYGCTLALKDLEDKAAAAAVAAAVEIQPSEPLSEPARPKLPAKTESGSSGSSTLPAVAGDLYERAVALVAKHSVVSTELVRTQLKIKQTRATELMRRLEADGVVGRPDPRDHHRRPVLAVVPAE